MRKVNRRWSDMWLNVLNITTVWASLNWSNWRCNLLKIVKSAIPKAGMSMEWRGGSGTKDLCFGIKTCPYAPPNRPAWTVWRHFAEKMSTTFSHIWLLFSTNILLDHRQFGIWTRPDFQLYQQKWGRLSLWKASNVSAKLHPPNADQR